LSSPAERDRSDVFFAADTHLRPGETEEQERLIKFLQFVQREGRALYLLGDIFDYWFEYKTAVLRCFAPVLEALRRLRQSGVEVHFLHGNHDFAVGAVFEEDLDVRVHPGPVSIEIGETSLYLTHGDELCRDDWAYRIIKRLMRNRVLNWLFAHIPVDWATRIGSTIAGASRRHVEHKDQERMAFSEDALEEVARQGYDVIIAAHAHEQADRMILEGKTRFFVLGQWSYLRYREGEGNWQFDE